jgi:NAD(P)-dependent dehydrogenase (short-subunit alcohol dehydrogenase family)
VAPQWSWRPTSQAESAVEQAVERFGRLDILVNNAGLMLLGPVVGADPDECDRMIAVNNQGLLYTTPGQLRRLAGTVMHQRWAMPRGAVQDRGPHQEPRRGRPRQ